MNDQINYGGPAFPWGEHGSHLGGMTLRDYFAAKAMQAYVQAHIALGTPLQDQGFDATVARWSYETADAMLEARKAPHV